MSDYHADLALTYKKRSDLLTKANRQEEAETLYRESLTIYRQLTEKKPSVYELRKAVVCFSPADILKKTGRSDEAGKYTREAEEIGSQEIKSYDAQKRT